MTSFRGSRSLETWIADLDAVPVDVESLCSGCEAHSGFWMAWESVENALTAQIQSAVEQHPDYALVFTGHSFGGAMATLGATVLRNAGYAVALVGCLPLGALSGC